MRSSGIRLRELHVRTQRGRRSRAQPDNASYFANGITGSAVTRAFEGKRRESR
jgi:hypothetical protein